MKRVEEEMKMEERKREKERVEEERKKKEEMKMEEERKREKKRVEEKKVEEEMKRMKRVEEEIKTEERKKKEEKEEKKREEERKKEERKRMEEELKRDQERKMEMKREEERKMEVKRVPPAPLAREEPRGDEEEEREEDEEGTGKGAEGSPAITEGRLGAIPEEVEPVEGNEVSGGILSPAKEGMMPHRGRVEVVEEEDEEMSPDEGSPVEEEVSRALGSRETTSSSDEEELVTTRVIRRRVIIKGEDVTDMPTDSVTEEQFTDEFGNIVTRKVTRKIIRRILSPDTGPTTGGLLDPSCHAQPGTVAASLTVGSSPTVGSPGTQRGAAEVSDSGGDAAPTTADAGGRERRVEGGDDIGERRSHVYKRTVVHADERHSGVLLTECSGGEAVMTRAVSDSVVTGSHAERRHGDPALTMDLSGAHLDFQQALLYAGAPPHVGDVDLLESTETVNPDGSTTTRTRMRKSTSREHSRTRAPKASVLERPGEDSSG
uniref:Histone-lysine N-methyltransferase, H3 lysine-79 specific-like n=1 Tax=Petromyzon marinus TaxID=7757 RepID=A0AAJ7T9K5_PETMA|nr:histone-lysine N-methyltransferase, H3 lysine-79 specific-like [Petromyzon marinus]